jgi:tetratricopeptide (TPR) repeat protein
VAADFPKFARAYSYEELGKYYRDAGETDRAEEMYERCMELYPGNPRVRFQLGSIYYNTDRFDLAKEQFAAVWQKAPDNHRVLEMLGKVAVKREANDEAVDWFARLVEVQPTNASGWEMLGYAATLAEQPEDVVRGYRRAMELDSSLEYHHPVGVALFQLGRYEEAAVAFQAAIARGAFEIQTRIGLAWALVEAGETRLSQGVPIPTAWLDQIDSQLRRIEEEDPEYPRLEDLRRRRGALRSTVSP